MALRGLQPPKPKESNPIMSNLGTIGTVVGGILGSVIPGAGTMAGASIGGTVGGVAQAGANVAQGAPKASQQTAQLDTMQRRQQQIEETPMMQLSQAHQASLELPPELQEQVQAPLKLAMQQAQKQGAPRYGA